ncbi:MAG TPA: gamma-glutamylcyclotransferase family protein [Candidatus Acidoferrum sp.]|nr:gamma-glutamylcyclotransferase family protein [Candidatus Acidoferrum sp.]
MARDPRARRPAGWSTSRQAIVDRLFVYGSLRSGQVARSLMADLVIGSQPATLTGSIYAVADSYPGYLPGETGTVVGEVVVLGDLAAALAQLDAYEGEEFERALAEVTLLDGSRVWAWCYQLVSPDLAEGAELIESGDWARYLSGD